MLELLIAIVLAALLLAAASGLIDNALGTEEVVEERNRLMREARFALRRMSAATGATDYVFVPQPDKPDTNWRENVREETVPASPPEGDSTKATAVLAVTLGPSIDLDANGIADADNDGDGRINEDPPADIANDDDPGIHLIDDGGEGMVDEGLFANADDDERLNASNEDPINGIDDDGDGVIDEDPGSDLNGDGAPGIAGVDDDGDGQVDEGNNADDDEDGVDNEDWYDAVVFYLQGDSLIERHPVPWDESGDGSLSGRDFVENVIAEGVTRFRVECPPVDFGRPQLIDLTLELSGESGQTVSLNTRVRVGSRR